MATSMNDSTMKIRLDRGDLIASERKYHKSCHLSFFNKYKRFKKDNINLKEKDDAMHEERAFIELVDSIKIDIANNVQAFSMADLSKLYDERKKQLGLETVTHSD